MYTGTEIYPMAINVLSWRQVDHGIPATDRIDIAMDFVCWGEYKNAGHRF